MLRKKTPMDRYLIKDPWTSRARTTLARVFVCSWRGHAQRPGFGGGLKPCSRCDR